MLSSSNSGSIACGARGVARSRMASVVLGSALAASCTPVLAQRWAVVPEADYPVYRYELWAGGEVAGRARSVWAGTTWAPFGDIRWDGLRLRSAATAGEYAYVSPRWDGKARTPVAFAGRQASTDLLLGWQQQVGRLTVKVFAGGSHETHQIAPFDEENAVQGARFGAKAALETWLALGPSVFLQSEVSWSQAFGAHGTRVRAGYRLLPAFALGAETAYVGNANYDAGRLGFFGRLEWSRGEVSVAGGVAGDREGAIDGYASVGIVFRY